MADVYTVCTNATCHEGLILIHYPGKDKTEFRKRNIVNGQSMENSMRKNVRNDG